MKGLARRRGKVVVIYIWASWCAPCLETMAEMQTCREKHPDWGDLVVLLAVSIDDTKNAAENHLEKRVE
jgi:thiol-disulfide isomerase/thioredoxin